MSEDAATSPPPRPAVGGIVDERGSMEGDHATEKPEEVAVESEGVAGRADISLLSEVASDDNGAEHDHDASFNQESSMTDADKDKEAVDDDSTPTVEPQGSTFENSQSELNGEQTSTGQDEHKEADDLARKPSKRTEDLIHAAARKIVEQIERRNEHEQGEQDGDHSVLSSVSGTSYGQEDGEAAEHSFAESSHVDHEEVVEEPHKSRPASVVPDEEGGESSSQNGGTDDDVFSGKSARNSMGSYDGGSESDAGPRKDYHHQDDENISVTTRTPRISDISHYDRQAEEDFIPTARGAGPRPAFRTPSDVRALQMSSPPPSLFGSAVGSPRSSKRPFPTVSRLGSPAPSAQYSPKYRTPSRFKVKNVAPVVLLHADLLALRWTWGDVLNNSELESSEMSEGIKSLRAHWRLLQDRMGDTLAERGLLLGHPQDDYEVLEERLLESLELPMRRRARILECGHYLGPTNEDSLIDDSDGDQDAYATDDSAQRDKKRTGGRHWCKTCKHEIAFEALGKDKIFRVKVFASNGLMTAGSWAACWKEMENVDVEIEPVVEAGLQDELARLAAIIEEKEHAQMQQVVELGATVQPEPERTEDIVVPVSRDFAPSQNEASPIHLEVPSPTRRKPSRSHRSASKDEERRLRDEERRLRDEERMREIYGCTPQPEPDASESSGQHEQPHPDSFIPTKPSPRSPSEEAHERRESRRRDAQQNDSLPELLLRSVRVLMRDRKNVMIVTLGVLVLLMALRAAPTQQQTPVFDARIYESRDVPRVQMEQQDMLFETAPSVAAKQESSTMEDLAAPELMEQQQASRVGSVDPCITPEAKQSQAGAAANGLGEETTTERKVIKVVETVTETEIHKVKVTSTATEVVKAPEPTIPAVEAAESMEEVADGIVGAVDVGDVDATPVPEVAMD